MENLKEGAESQLFIYLQQDSTALMAYILGKTLSGILLKILFDKQGLGWDSRGILHSLSISDNE